MNGTNPHATPEQYLGRFLEKVGLKFWYGWFQNSDYGLLPKEYNKKVHGHYYPWRYYGKADVPFEDVKLGELGSWISRRNKSPRAMWAALTRYRFRLFNRWFNVRYMNMALVWQLAAIYAFLAYQGRYRKGGLKYQKQYRYHW